MQNNIQNNAGKSLSNARTARLDMVVRSIGSRAQLVSRTLKMDSGLEFTRYQGFLIGFSIAVFMVLILPLAVWAVLAAGEF